MAITERMPASLPVEHLWNSVGQRKTLKYSLPNERYDDVGFPYGFVVGATQSSTASIGVGVYFVEEQRLFQAAMIIPIATEMNVRAARDLGYQVLRKLIDSLSFTR